MLSLQQTTAQRDVGVSRSYQGVRALWLKVIIRAVFDWVSYRDSTKHERRMDAESAHWWLFRTNDFFNSFENVCVQLDLDPNRVRTWANGVTKDQVAKIEHLDRSSSARGRSDLEVKSAELFLVSTEPDDDLFLEF